METTGVKRVVQAAAFLGVAQGAAFLARPKGASSLALRFSRKPKWLVSNRAMGPLWIGGFALLGLSGFAAWRSGARSALPFWGAYLAGNALATRFGHDVANSGARNLLGLALLSTYASRAGREAPAARWLAAPYIAWLGYVALGTQALRRRNPLLSKLF